jgi:hypothetical protein
MKKALATVALTAMSTLGWGVATATVAHADPSATECHSITVNVNGSDVVNQAACNTLPPQ